MPANPLDMIVAQANAIKQQADALLLFCASLEPIQPSPESLAPEGRQPGMPQKPFRSFDDDGRQDVIRRVDAPLPDSSGDLRPTSTS